MPKPKSAALLYLVQCIIVGLALAFLVSVLWPSATHQLRATLGLAQPAGATSAAPATTAVAASGARGPAPASYAHAVQKAAPAVVNIYANKVVTERLHLYPAPLMRRLFGGIAFGPAYKHREQSLGSGVIFTRDGYILTNNHVISGADQIQVMLHDKRIASAKVVGTDALTDLAVLKVPDDDLPAISVADDQPLQVGDVVLAIGNPFGIGQTVTLGIVSGLQRQLSSSTYENFIQTDAAINAGNSGGALVNAAGSLVGINTAMLGRRSGAEGIGFAIPVGTAQRVMRQIIQHGHVIRGWIGAEFRPLRSTNGNGTPGSTPTHGALVVNVYPRSPAADAGLRRGDIVLEMNGQAIPGPAWLLAREAGMQPGTRITLSGRRNDAPLQLTLTLGQRPQNTQQPASPQRGLQ